MSEWDVVFERSTADGGMHVLAVVGEIDLAVAARFAEELDSLLEDADSSAGIVDLSRVGFIDSSGVRELLRAKHSAETAGRDLVLRAPSAPCRHVLEISGVWDEFTVRDAPE